MSLPENERGPHQAEVVRRRDRGGEKMGSTDQVKSGWRAFDIAADDGETISDRRSRRRAAAERGLGKKKVINKR